MDSLFKSLRLAMLCLVLVASAAASNGGDGSRRPGCLPDVLLGADDGSLAFGFWKDSNEVLRITDAGELEFWDVSSGHRRETYLLYHLPRAVMPAATAAAFHPEGTWVAIGYANGDVVAYDTRNVLRIGQPLRLSNGVTAMAISAGNILAVGTRQPAVHFFTNYLADEDARILLPAAPASLRFLRDHLEVAFGRRSRRLIGPAGR